MLIPQTADRKASEFCHCVSTAFDILSLGFIEQLCHCLMPVRGHGQCEIPGNGSPQKL